MLAVNVDQQLAESFEIALRAGSAVDIAARATFGSDHAAQNAGPFGIEVALRKPGAGVGIVVQIEAGEDVCLVSTQPYHAAVGTVAERQAQRIEHDRLAGPGLSADHAHAAFQL